MCVVKQKGTTSLIIRHTGDRCQLPEEEMIKRIKRDELEKNISENKRAFRRVPGNFIMKDTAMQDKLWRQRPDEKECRQT